MAQPNGSGDVHLISDHDNIGETQAWCGAEFVSTSESLAEVTCLLCLKAAKIYGEGATARLQHLTESVSVEGREALWLWFELSYAGFLTIPRVLMHAMPDAWQAKMAELLTEYSETFSNWPDGAGTRVQYTISNRLAPMPPWLTNYRHPNKAEIDKLRGPHGPTNPKGNQRAESGAS